MIAPAARARIRTVRSLVLGGDPDLARAVWAFAHGMATLELNDRFPPDADVDPAWGSGVAAFRGSATGA